MYRGPSFLPHSYSCGFEHSIDACSVGGIVEKPKRCSLNSDELQSTEDGSAVALASSLAIGANCLLWVIVVTVCIVVGILIVLVAATVDQTTDVFIALLLMMAMRKMQNFNPKDYPRGRKMLELIIVLGFCCVASTLALTVIIQAIQELAQRAHATIQLDALVIGLFVASAFINGAFFAYLWYTFRVSNSAGVILMA